MSVLTHKLGMVLNLSEPLEPDHREFIERNIAGKTGVVSAYFSLSEDNMVVIEYDPYITSPAELHQNINEINSASVLKTVFVSRPQSCGKDEEASRE